MSELRILLAGEGGQGVQTIAEVLADAFALEGKEVSYIPSFGVEQRGTPSVAYLIIGNKEIRYPKFELADYLIILQKRAINTVKRYSHIGAKIIFDSSTIAASDLPDTKTADFGIPATQIAAEEYYPKAFNLIVLGKLAKVFGLDPDKVWQLLFEQLKSKFKTKEIEKQAEAAFRAGYEFVFEVKKFSEPAFQPAKHNIIVKGYKKTATIVPERCKGCGLCITKCPVAALKFGKELGVYATPVPEIDLERCINCGNCRLFCPDGAIEVVKDK